MKSNRLISMLLCGALAAFFTGCATTPKTDAMAVTSLNLEQTHAATVGVHAAGTTEGSSSIMSDIPSAALAQAVEESILNTGLFEAVLPVADADYRLAVMVVSVDKPMAGLNMTVKAELAWTLTRLSDNKIVWSQALNSSATKGMGDELSGASRLRAAVEAAVQENIKQALQIISELELQ